MVRGIQRRPETIMGKDSESKGLSIFKPGSFQTLYDYALRIKVSPEGLMEDSSGKCQSSSIDPTKDSRLPRIIDAMCTQFTENSEDQSKEMYRKRGKIIELLSKFSRNTTLCRQIASKREVVTAMAKHIADPRTASLLELLSTRVTDRESLKDMIVVISSRIRTEMKEEVPGLRILGSTLRQNFDARRMLSDCTDDLLWELQTIAEKFVYNSSRIKRALAHRLIAASLAVNLQSIDGMKHSKLQQLVKNFFEKAIRIQKGKKFESELQYLSFVEEALKDYMRNTNVFSFIESNEKILGRALTYLLTVGEDKSKAFSEMEISLFCSIATQSSGSAVLRKVVCEKLDGETKGFWNGLSDLLSSPTGSHLRFALDFLSEFAQYIKEHPSQTCLDISGVTTDSKEVLTQLSRSQLQDYPGPLTDSQKCGIETYYPQNGFVENYLDFVQKSTTLKNMFGLMTHSSVPSDSKSLIMDLLYKLQSSGNLPSLWDFMSEHKLTSELSNATVESLRSKSRLGLSFATFLVRISAASDIDNIISLLDKECNMSKILASGIEEGLESALEMLSILGERAKLGSSCSSVIWKGTMDELKCRKKASVRLKDSTDYRMMQLNYNQQRHAECKADEEEKIRKLGAKLKEEQKSCSKLKNELKLEKRKNEDLKAKLFEVERMRTKLEMAQELKEDASLKLRRFERETQALRKEVNAQTSRSKKYIQGFRKLKAKYDDLKKENSNKEEEIRACKDKEKKLEEVMHAEWNKLRMALKSYNELRRLHDSVKARSDEQRKELKLNEETLVSARMQNEEAKQKLRLVKYRYKQELETIAQKLYEYEQKLNTSQNENLESKKQLSRANNIIIGLKKDYMALKENFKEKFASVEQFCKGFLSPKSQESKKEVITPEKVVSRQILGEVTNRFVY